jgi:hypothetical protein
MKKLMTDPAWRIGRSRISILFVMNLDRPEKATAGDLNADNQGGMS